MKKLLYQSSSNKWWLYQNCEYFLLTAVLMFSYIDIVTTRYILQFPGYIETNYIAKHFIYSNIPFIWEISIGVTIVICFLFGKYFEYKLNSKLAYLLLFFMLLCEISAVIINLQNMPHIYSAESWHYCLNGVCY